MIKTVKHSRLDREHYETCNACYEDHLDFMDSLRQDEQDDAREMEAACED